MDGSHSMHLDSLLRSSAYRRELQVPGTSFWGFGLFFLGFRVEGFVGLGVKFPSRQQGLSAFGGKRLHTVRAGNHSLKP